MALMKASAVLLLCAGLLALCGQGQAQSILTNLKAKPEFSMMTKLYVQFKETSGYLDAPSTVATVLPYSNDELVKLFGSATAFEIFRKTALAKRFTLNTVVPGVSVDTTSLSTTTLRTHPSLAASRMRLPSDSVSFFALTYTGTMANGTTATTTIPAAKFNSGIVTLVSFGAKNVWGLMDLPDSIPDGTPIPVDDICGILADTFGDIANLLPEGVTLPISLGDIPLCS